MNLRTPRQGSGGYERAKRQDIVGLGKALEAMIYPHIFGSADREVGGVLVGRAPREWSLPMITGAIPALSADEQRATLTFTQDAWEHVHRTLDRDFPADDQIVGWYHSHPSFGIFLSEHDLFIHRNFFSGPAQIALVVDPINRTEGVFVWRDGDIVQLFERPTPDDWVARSSRGRLPPVTHIATVEPTPRADTRPLVLAVVLASVIGFVFGFGVWDAAFRPADTTTHTPLSSPAHRLSHVHGPRTSGPPGTTGAHQAGGAGNG